VPADLPVAVLVSGRTFSSGEALAYHLQARDRVTIVGERTPGAADHVTDIRLAATVTGELPSGYCTDSVTGTNWEGRGVAPQVDCAADDAIAAALAHPVIPARLANGDAGTRTAMPTGARRRHIEHATG
jgi:C-terminal processing protease CtpA/Prc